MIFMKLAKSKKKIIVAAGTISALLIPSLKN